ncbi:MAG: hypothetical protein AB1921_11755 [Thermodesulfobacteriota bacterium]
MEKKMESLAGMFADAASQWIGDHSCVEKARVAVTEVFSLYSDVMALLCDNDGFTRKLLLLAEGEKVNAADLVEEATECAKKQGVPLSRKAIAEKLKGMVEAMKSKLSDIVPHSANLPDSFDMLFESFNTLPLE